MIEKEFGVHYNTTYIWQLLRVLGYSAQIPIAAAMEKDEEYVKKWLSVPRMKSEIAKITTTDWKEVDRNIRILSSVDLVKTEFIHGSFSVYELTER